MNIFKNLVQLIKQIKRHLLRPTIQIISYFSCFVCLNFTGFYKVNFYINNNNWKNLIFDNYLYLHKDF